MLKLTYLQPLHVVDQTRPAHVAWVKDHIDAAAADELITTDPYLLAGLVSYERTGFNASLRAPGL